MKSVAVIGGGLGGLSAAISLARSGYEVSLYEKNVHLGGKLNRLEQDGFGFDLGPSILTMPHIFDKLFVSSNRRMADYIRIQKVEHEWRSFFPDGTVIDLYGDLERMAENNPHLDARAMAEYKDFLAYARRLYEATDRGYFSKGLDTFADIVKEHGVVGAMREFDFFSTMYGAIRKRISHPRLREMLAYFIKYVGSSPYDAPSVLNMMIYMQHAQGIWYVPGGMHRIAEGMTRLAKELGVKLYTGRKATQLVPGGGSSIQCLVLEDGSMIRADYYVSNMEVIPAYEQLLDEEPAFIRKLEKRFEPSSSGLVLHLGVSGSYPQLAHHNFFFSERLKEQMNKVFRRHELPDDPTIYLVNVNKTDPSQAPPGHENLKILPHIPYIQDEPFSAEDYERLRERVLVKLERMGLTDLRRRIVTEDMWTPHHIEAAYGSHRGSIYGTVSDRSKNYGFKHPKQSVRYDNLYFVGGTVNPGAGMPMVTLSGQQVRDKIVERDAKLAEHR
ncbi:phytoene desaturase family protein [Paenibacillus soyae]|uniref:4,4'-diaponeurosporene oxygenase n=1 Tax=Paenibacillus soyae TaxID=2969249 RepID=A0A9X2SCH8_9BACL|nr:phytoene desaturase family protein [Paenibacillus soyae]MCR2806798.1 phytoene desaturase family protein [Paenibacillus soyae]